MLDNYIDILKNGGVVAFPTETVYGLGASAWNPEAIRKIFEIKGRPTDNPLIVHVSSIDMVSDFAINISTDAQKLMHAFWPGPLTLIFPKKSGVLDIITAGLDTVAIRMPNHPVALSLIAETGPLVAPSANTSGKPSPTKAVHVTDDFGSDFPVIDGGTCYVGIESTVLDISREPFEIFRPGKIHKTAIEEVINKTVKVWEHQKYTGIPKSPGMKYTHYSPEAKVRWLQKDEKLVQEDTLYLIHSERDQSLKHNIISYAGNYDLLTQELYDRFRQADKEGFKTIAIESFESILKSNEILIALVNRISKAIGS